MKPIRKYMGWLMASVAAVGVLVGSLAASAAEPNPAEYPASWGVVFTPSKPLPKSYVFGHKITILPLGSVYPPAAKPLPCAISWERDVPVTLRDGTVIYVDILKAAGDNDKLPAIVAWSPYGKTLPTPARERRPCGMVHGYW